VTVQKVTTGPSDGKNTVILSGISNGQTVVTDGMDRLSDGATIKLAGAKPAESSSAPASASSSAATHQGRKHKKSSDSDSSAS
jgi:multidrug efflux system membrane fusion protein